MGRKQYKHIGTNWDAARSSLGDGPVDNAIGRLKTVQQKAVATMTSYHGSRRGVIDLMFNPNTIRRANDVRGIVDPRTQTMEYTVAEGVSLTIDFDSEITPTIIPSSMQLQPGFDSLVGDYIRAVQAVHMQYEELKGVVRWLNRNATPGAIRYLFPQAMKLVPDSPIWKDLQQVPSRYSQPDGIAAWTQSIKDAANTFVAMALLPEDAKPRPRDRGMWLTFKPRKVHLDRVNDPHAVHYVTDDIVYNI